MINTALWKDFLRKEEIDPPMATDAHRDAVIVYTSGATVNKLFLQRLEEFIAAHPLVKMCAVDVVPDALRMNVPVAYIVLQGDVDETIDPKGAHFILGRLQR